MVIDHRYEKFGKVRRTLSFAVYPIKKIVDGPISLTQNLGSFWTTQRALLAENQLLKEESLLQQGRLQRLVALETENQQLRQLLQSGSEVTDKFLIANVINVDPDPFTHQIMIDKGLADKVYVGQTVIDSDGIMGTVTVVNDIESRAILITDASHAIPVENVRNGLRAIAVGTGSGRLELRHVPNTTDIIAGDTMLTSGLGGRFPVGFPVGVVKEVNHEPGKPFATIVLEPSAKLDRTRHVLLINKDAKR